LKLDLLELSLTVRDPSGHVRVFDYAHGWRDLRCQLDKKNEQKMQVQLVAGVEESCFSIAAAVETGIMFLNLSFVNSWSTMVDPSLFLQQ
jgi:hypothetical protein